MSGFLCQGEKNILNSFSKQKKCIGIFLTGATSRKTETAAPKVDWEKESSGTVGAWKQGTDESGSMREGVQASAGAG